VWNSTVRSGANPLAQRTLKISKTVELPDASSSAPGASAVLDIESS